MANYTDSTLFIKGSKKAVASFLNRGLKGNKTKERVTARMTGEEIVTFLNGLEKPLHMGSYLPRPKTYDVWDTTNEMKDFYDWYVGGCVSYDCERMKQRTKEIKDYMLANPSEFPVLPPDSFDDIFGPSDGVAFKESDWEKAARILHPELIPGYDRYVKGYKRATVYQQKKYGVVGWYDWNCKNYGCKWDEKLKTWSLKCERRDIIILSAGISTPWSEPLAFIDRINQIEGITVYAYGGEEFEYFFSFNGRTGETVWNVPEEDPRYKKYKKAYKKSDDYDPDWAPYAISDMIITDCAQAFKAELEKEFLKD